jgi:hypothetical protein
MSWARLLKRVFEIDIEECPPVRWHLEDHRRHRTSPRDRQDPCMFVFNDFYILLFGRGRPLDPWDDKPEGGRGSPRLALINPNGCWGP